MVKSNKSDEFVADWQRLEEDTPNSVKQMVSALVRQYAAELADMFYKNMMTDTQAKSFLNHDLVSQRLQASMQRWLLGLFSEESQDPRERDTREIYKYQCLVGEVHARIQVPFSLVKRGARLLRNAISDYMVESQMQRGELVNATNYINAKFELAMDAMTDYFVIDMEKHARADEGYRMFALGQNMLAERERQRAALLEWAQQILLGLLANMDGSELPEIKKSEFGMWFKHKASIIFETAPELELIRQRIEQLEKSILPKVFEMRRNSGDARMLLKEIETEITEIKFLLGGLFDRFIEVESGRDTLTRLLNRRYLPSVLTREMSMARRLNVPFALLLIDLDHFKVINDSYGHAAGDQVLMQAADMIVGSVRAGDFVFRYGGEEMLVVLVEIDKKQALLVAETIREKFAAESFRVGESQTANITVSIGIATYSGHPDYETMIKDADGALYQAKEAGRNRCVLSGR